MVNYFKVIGDCNDNDDAPFSTIYAYTPWQVLHSPPRICQRGLAGFALAPLQRSHNERIRLYTITFLPPGRFLQMYFCTPLYH